MVPRLIQLCSHHLMLLTRVLGLLNPQTWIRNQVRSSSKALLGLVLHQEGKQAMDTLACSPRRQGPLNRVRGGMGPRVGPEGGLGGLPTCLVVRVELGFSPDTSGGS